MKPDRWSPEREQPARFYFWEPVPGAQEIEGEPPDTRTVDFDTLAEALAYARSNDLYPAVVERTNVWWDEESGVWEWDEE